MMSQRRSLLNKAVLHELTDILGEVSEDSLSQVVYSWEVIYGTKARNIVDELIAEFKKHYEDFFKQQKDKLDEFKDELIHRIHTAGIEAVTLEKALGLEQQVQKIQNDGPLVLVEEQLLSLVGSYKEIRNERLEDYFDVQKKEKDLCSLLNVAPPQYKIEAPEDGNVSYLVGAYVPSADDVAQAWERIRELEQRKEELEYNFENAKDQILQLMAECKISPLSKEERFAAGECELDVTQENLNLMMASIKELKVKKNDLIAEADHLRDEISRLAKKMFKSEDEQEELLLAGDGFDEQTIYKLKAKLRGLKQERKDNLKELIESSRQSLRALWDKCCYSQEQRNKFKAFSAAHCSEEVLDFLELEIENLEDYYNANKKIILLAKKHEELWNRMLHLEELANDKDRLFNNRGGCLLKEEKERKLIQKKLPAIKDDLMGLLQGYEKENREEFLYNGESLKQLIEQKEQLRELSKHQERLLRKTANAENVMLESRLGARPLAGGKRKAPMTPQDSNRIKTMRTEVTAMSCASSKSTLSAKSTTSSVQKRMDLLPYPTNHFMKTPTSKKTPAASTPQNGSLSYESFQEHIEKSKYLAHNSTRKNEQQRILRPKDLNQTRTIIDKATPYKTPKTPAKTARKTPSKAVAKTPTKTPSRIPFRIPTGSKIPSQVTPLSPRKPAALSTTKLPIIF